MNKSQKNKENDVKFGILCHKQYNHIHLKAPPKNNNNIEGNLVKDPESKQDPPNLNPDI